MPFAKNEGAQSNLTPVHNLNPNLENIETHLCNKNEIGISTFKDVTQVFKKYSFPISKLRPKSVFHESLTPGEEFFLGKLENVTEIYSTNF